MRNRVCGFVVFILLLMLNSFAFAQPPQISTGLTWLNSSQTTTGNWPGVETDEYYSTAAALDAAYALEPASASYTSGLAWLGSQVVSPTDYLSRRIIALKRAGQDVSGEIAALLQYHNPNGDVINPDGAWGGDFGYSSDALDTALALQAFHVANYTNMSDLFYPIAFLIATQNINGGWGLVFGEDSNVYVTAMVVKALAPYKFYNCTGEASLNKGIAYLLSKQNADGGFGSSPSTVYESALAFDALIASGANMASMNNPLTDLTQGQAAINYLATTQSVDGSWNDDPYSTALALQALANVKPNLSLTTTDITFSKLMPQTGESITITAAIKNTGLEPASSIIARFYQGDPLAGGVQIDSDKIIPSLTPNSSTPVSVTASFTGTGTRNIFVVADPDNLISEITKVDNRAMARLWVATGSDLAIYSEDLKTSTYMPVSETPFTLTYIVRNQGETDTGAFVVSLYDGNPASGGTVLSTANVSGIPGTQARTGTIGVTLTGDGSHTLYLVADAGNQITEISKTNNTGAIAVNVGALDSGADLAVTQTDITLTPSRPHAGDTVTIVANVRNQGTQTADNFLVEMFDGAPDQGGILIYTQALSLAAGAQQSVTGGFSVSPGIHTIYVVLDKTNQIIETNETNNTASVSIMTDMVDISLSATDLVFNPSSPVVGDTVAFSITAHNQGIAATGPFNLALYDGDPQTGGTLLQTYAVNSIQGDGSATLTYTFTAVPKTYRFYAVADPDNHVTEMSKGNNTAIRALTIKAQGELLGPDLVPIKIDLTDTTTDPQTLAISGIAHVTVQNKGDSKITTPFDIIIFEDKDGDAKYTPGVDNLISTGTNTMNIWPGGANMLDLPLSGTVKFLHSPMYAMVDSGDAILEQDETNNLLLSCKDCEVVPSNPIEPVVKWTKLNHSSPHQPVIANLNDDNGDGKIDNNDIPDIIYTTYESIYNSSMSELWAIDGRTGETLFVIHPVSDVPGYGLIGQGIPAVGDIDGDGLPEIVFPKRARSGLLAYSNTGILKWDNSAQVTAWNSTHNPYYVTIHEASAPTIADIDGDGIIEIVVGATVINNDGSIRFVGKDRFNTYGTGQFYYGNHWSIVADLDLDGKQEIIGGHTAYNHDGTVKWNVNLPDGLNAIGNFDDDPYPEIVLMTTRPFGLYMLEHDGTIKWGPVSFDDFWSAPLVADFDGDGEPEIGVKRINYYDIIDKNGNLKKRLFVPYYSGIVGNSMHSAPTVFDLNGDGKPEVLFNSDFYFRIFDGKEGTLLYQESFKSPNPDQGVIIADVDNDGHAEAVLTGYGYAGGNVMLKVYGSANNDWVNARKIWNQASYHVTNVNDDGTIPKNEAPSWLTNNTYRTQAAIGPIINPYLTPNLTASLLRVDQNGTNVNLTLRVGNGGAIAAPSGVNVTFYDGDPSASGIVIGTTATTKILQPGDYQDITLSASTLGIGLHHIYAVVNGCLNGSNCSSRISECNYDDNQTNMDFTVNEGSADLKIGSEDIALPAAPYL